MKETPVLYAVKIASFGDISVIPYPRRTPDHQIEELKWMEGQIKGKARIVDGLKTGYGTAMIINRDGKLLGLPHNDIAQELMISQTDYITGDAVVLKTIGTELVGMTSAEVAEASGICRIIREQLTAI